MIDYVQSVIAAVEPANPQKEVTDEDWRVLSGLVKSLFKTICVQYQMCLTSKRRVEDPTFNLEFEEFRSCACKSLEAISALIPCFSRQISFMVLGRTEVRSASFRWLNPLFQLVSKNGAW